MKSVINITTPDGKVVNTLLSNHIQTQIGSYNEPGRKGVPFGDTVGFSLPKYAAACLFLYDLPQKIIAEKVGCSYGVLRVWASEAAFKKAVKVNCRDFAMIFIKRMLARIEINDGIFEAHLNDPAQQGKPVFLNYDEFIDLGSYSLKLLEEIRKAIDAEFKRLGQPKSVRLAMQLVGCPALPVNEDVLRETLRSLKNLLIDSAIESLKNPTDENLKLCSIVLEMLRGDDAR